MSIRFSCLTCRTVLKLGEMITEPRKVRCTGCNIVLLVEPDPTNPMEVKASVPEQNLNKHKSRSDKELARRRNLLLGALAVFVIGSIVALWWFTRAPADRGAIEGSVTLDGDPLGRGTITFIPQDGKSASVPILINQGKYRASASVGPMIGKNKVEIRGEKKTGNMRPKPGGSPGETIEEVVEAVADRYHTLSKEYFEVKAGSNSKDFEVKSK